jgi:hypothetical protein
MVELSRAESRQGWRVLPETRLGVRVDWPDGAMTHTRLETIMKE